MPAGCSRSLGPRSSRSNTPSVGIRFGRGGIAWTGGDSLWHLVQSRGKLSVAADLHDPDEPAFVRQLAAESDVLIEASGRVGSKVNLDPQELMRANPRLIVVRISGYGQTGPMRDQPAFGTIAEAAGGLRFAHRRGASAAGAGRTQPRRHDRVGCTP